MLVPRDRTGLGVKRIESTIRRAGRETLDAGIEYLPSGSLIAPAGSAGGAGGAGAFGWTAAVGLLVASAEPRVFLAVTRTRIRVFTSDAPGTKVDFVWPLSDTQLLPFPSHRSHW